MKKGIKSSSEKVIMLTVEMKKGSVIYIKLPQFSGTADEGSEYAAKVYDVLREHKGD